MPTFFSSIITRLGRREARAVEKQKIKSPVLNPPLPGTISLPALCRAGSEESYISGGIVTPDLGLVDDAVRIKEGNECDPYSGGIVQSPSKCTITQAREDGNPSVPVIVVTAFETNEKLSKAETEVEQSPNSSPEFSMDSLELFWHRRLSTPPEEEEDIGDHSFCSIDSYDSIDAVMNRRPQSRLLHRIEEEIEDEQSLYSEMSWASNFPHGVMEDIDAILAECRLTEEEIWGDWSRWVPNRYKICRSLTKKN